MSEFQAYKAQVLADYDQKRAANELPLEMNDPTTADLKNECLRQAEKKFDEKCKKVLETLFEKKEDLGAYRKVLKEEGVDKCRPLYNFLKDRSIDTADRNIELLAWLIDFQPRPYVLWLKDPNRHKKTKPPVIIQDGPPEERWWRKPLTIAALIIFALLVSGGVYIMGHGEGGSGPSTEKTDSLHLASLKKKPTACMVWKEDHYEEAPCDRAADGGLIVPLDADKLVHLKKVAPSRVTANSIGHLWYFKKQGQLECFTDSGAYPPDTNRRLLRLTAYMYHQYLEHKSSTN